MLDAAKFASLPLLGILRGQTPDEAARLAAAMVSAGLETAEVAMNTPEAASVIKKLKESSAGQLCVGAGTVLDMESLKTALGAGAEFIVMPVLVREVAQYCAKNKIPFFPGALTPGEIYACHRAGAAMVKVFPAKVFGPAYFREVKAPLDGVRLLACGGVSASNIGEYFASGADAAAFGASIFSKELIDAGKYGEIENSIKELIAACKSALNTAFSSN